MLEAGWPVNTPGEMGATALGRLRLTMLKSPVTYCTFTRILKLNRGSMRGLRCHGPSTLLETWLASEHGRFRGSNCALLDAGAALPPDPEALRTHGDAVLEVLP